MLEERSFQYSRVLNSILDEAVDLEMMPKNPADKLAVPRSGKRSATKHLRPEQIPLILFQLSDRDRLIVRMFLVNGLRPGEMFALRWNDKQGNSCALEAALQTHGGGDENGRQRLLRLDSSINRHRAGILAWHPT